MKVAAWTTENVCRDGCGPIDEGRSNAWGMPGLAAANVQKRGLLSRSFERLQSGAVWWLCYAVPMSSV